MATAKNNFNLLRLIFAGMVIISHAAELKDGNRSHELLTVIFGTISFGELAVDSFFIISGYLITRSWIESPNFFRYLRSRVLRIYPGFICASLICAFILGPMVSGQTYFSEFNYFDYIKSLIFLKPPKIPEVFHGSFYPDINGSMWTIFYEFSCYVLVAAFGLLGIYKKKIAILFLCLALATLYFLNEIHAIELIKTQKYVRLGMVFFAGSCFYLYEKIIPWKMTYAITSILIAISLLFSKGLAEISLAIFWGYAILYFAKNAKEIAVVNKIPDFSFGLYLYAWPINKTIYWYFPETGVYACMIVTVLLSIISGIVSWYLIEKPFLKLKSMGVAPGRTYPSFARKAHQPTE
jgi:peptidoglycan/LPS O-acetylase OafA/YrhL